MTKYLPLLLCLASGQLSAANWRPTERLLHAVRFVESSHGQFTVGDHGESLGDYQISEAAWLDVSFWRKAHGLPTFKYERHVWDREVSREYASNYLTILYGELKKHLNHSPNAAELYAAYNMGLASFAQCRYQLANVNRTTAKKCQKIADIMGEE